MSAAELWVYLDDEDGRAPDLPGRMAAECLRLARLSNLAVRAVVASAAGAARLGAAAAVGAGAVYALCAATGPRPLTARRAAQLLAAAVRARAPFVVLLPATAQGAEIGARVAAELGAACLSRCVDIDWADGRPVARRAVYDNRAHQVVAPLGAPPWVATVDTQVLDAAAVAATANPPVEVLDLGLDPAAAEPVTETWRVPARELDVLDADIVLSVGRGVPAPTTLEQVHELSALLGAAVGGSREAVFGGLVTRDRQVGASGKWIAPRVYVALGISGSTYHLMGIREAKHVVAVNLDQGAPIFERAEVGVVDCVTKIVPALIAAVKARAAGGVGKPAEGTG